MNAVNADILLLIIVILSITILPFVFLYIYQTIRNQQLKRQYQVIAAQAGLSYQPGPEWCPHQIVGIYRGREFSLHGLAQPRFQASWLFKFFTNTMLDPRWELEIVPVRIKLKLANKDFVTLKLVGRNWLGALLNFEAQSQFERLFLVSLNPENFRDMVLNKSIKAKLMQTKRPFSMSLENYELAYEQGEPLTDAATTLALFELLSDIGDRVEALQGIEVLQKTK
ncbi:MAG: hypothetical protein JNL09_01210 [Anaerolineales bacterium]|nr:hypothetical protein [Anaerolineales bacterium]